MVVEFSYFGEFGAFLFTFLLAFGVIYAILTKTKFLSKENTINALVTTPVAMLLGASGVYKLLGAFVPFLIFLIFFIFAIFVVLGFMRVDPNYLFGNKYFKIGMVVVLVFFVTAAGWKVYQDSVTDTMRQLALLNGTNDTARLNLTGNPFTDTSIRYQYYCSVQGKYYERMSNMVFWCTLMHPRITGALLILITLLIVTTIWMNYGSRFNPKKKS